MYVQPASFTGSALKRGQRPIREFMRQWEAVKSQRGARYHLVFTFYLKGSRRLYKAICLDEVRPGVFLMEMPPLGPDLQIRQYFTLVRKNGKWIFGDKTIAGIDRRGHTASGRGRLMREHLV